MKMKLSLKNKMQLFLISLSVAIYGIAIGYISINAKKTAYNDSVALVISSAEKFALKIQADLNEDHAVVRTLAQAFTVYPDIEPEEWKSIYTKIYKFIYQKNDFYKIWDSWELSKIDDNWTKTYGRLSNNVFTENNTIKHSSNLRNLDGDNGLYADIKAKEEEMILPIYFDQMVGANQEPKLMSSLLTPIKIDDVYHGIVGIDIILEGFQKMVENISLDQFDGSHAFLISYEGKFASHQDDTLLNQDAQFTLKSEEVFDLQKLIIKGEIASIITVDDDNKSHFVAFAPINIGKTNTPWFLGVSVPVNSIMAQADRNFMISLIVGIIGIFLLSFAIYVVTKNISDPIQRITEFLKELALGKTNSKLDLNINSGDEIEEMTRALETSIQGLNLKTEFANQIESGNLEHEFNLLSDDDKLGLALVEMRNSLKKARIDEQERKSDDTKRNWATGGLAKFADILRQNNDDLKTLSHEIIKNLVYYLEASQGGLFLLDDEDKSNIVLNLISAFAFNRKKHIEKQIEYGDGIVGSVAIEKETTYIEDLPKDYISIVSGLGDSTPNALLVVPLKMEDKVFGVIEIASFKKFEKYQIEFVEKVAENIAVSMSSVQINIKTNELLEKFQQQSEEMAAQEEEMRQNMEELQATQEEAGRKNAEMESFLHALEQSSCIVEYSIEGFVIKVNDKYLNLLNLRRSEVLGVHHSDKMEFTKKQKEEYDKFWNDLKKGKTKKEKTKLTIDDKEIVFLEVYTPILDENGTVNKILKISNNTNEF
jgi:methyl-accepting chemotaxis protein